MRTSRAFFSEVERRFDAVPFTLSASEDEKKAQMVLLKPEGPIWITSGLIEPDLYNSEKEIQDTELNKGSSPEFCELKSPEKEGLQDCRECHQWRDIRRE
ncbi:hypothetical protein U0070_019994 [Myodes glareolus]|uniref:Uncharacterized protein n=1 Tax=Myodes glareolus TaxID=447135 RepID=A0AAW0I8N9_MYOGA